MTLEELKEIVIEKFKASLIQRNQWSKVIIDSPDVLRAAILQEDGMIIAYGDIIKTIDPDWELDPNFKAYEVQTG
jgi:hypothetical protein